MVLGGVKWCCVVWDGDKWCWVVLSGVLGCELVLDQAGFERYVATILRRCGCM